LYGLRFLNYSFDFEGLEYVVDYRPVIRHDRKVSHLGVVPGYRFFNDYWTNEEIVVFDPEHSLPEEGPTRTVFDIRRFFQKGDDVLLKLYRHPIMFVAPLVAVGDLVYDSRYVDRVYSMFPDCRPVLSPEHPYLCFWLEDVPVACLSPVELSVEGHGKMLYLKQREEDHYALRRC
jgi:hypothetical protein